MNSKELKFYLEPYKGHIIDIFDNLFDDTYDNDRAEINLTFGFYKKDFNMFLELLGVLLFLINSKRSECDLNILKIGVCNWTRCKKKERRLAFIQFEFYHE